MTTVCDGMVSICFGNEGKCVFVRDCTKSVRPQRLKSNAILMPLLMLFLFRMETLVERTPTTMNQRISRPYVLFSTFRFDTLLLPYAMAFQLCIGNNCDVCNVLYYYIKCTTTVCLCSLARGVNVYVMLFHEIIECSSVLHAKQTELRACECVFMSM